MTPTRLSKLAQIALHVRDLDRAIVFYRETLGVPFLFQAPPRMAFFDCGGVRLLIGEAQAGETPRGGYLYFAVDDITAEHARLSAAGVAFTSGPMMIAKLPDSEVWLAEFSDGEGNALALMSESHG
jgi:methylmalonyl-CoA/ethylmalonyl-CoA epimerase